MRQFFDRTAFEGTNAERLARITATFPPENGSYFFCTDTGKWWIYYGAWYPVTGSGGMPLLINLVRDAANLTTVTVLAGGTCQVHYIGVCPQISNSINLLANVTTAFVAGAGGTPWAEIAIYTGTPTLNGNVPDLTRLGSADVSAVYNATGRKNTAINLAIPAIPGDNLWAVLGCNIGVGGTVFQVRGGLADDIQCGLFQTLAQRPSTWAGPGAGTLASAVLVPAWVAIKVN